MTDNCASALEAGLGALSQNDLSVEVHPATLPIEKYGTDEIGQTAAITNKLLAKLKTTIESYETARMSLADTIGQVKAAAEALAGSRTAQRRCHAIRPCLHTSGPNDQPGRDRGQRPGPRSVSDQRGESVSDRDHRARRRRRGQHSDSRPGSHSRPRCDNAGDRHRPYATRIRLSPLNERVESALAAGSIGGRRNGRRNAADQGVGRDDVGQGHTNWAPRATRSAR